MCNKAVFFDFLLISLLCVILFTLFAGSYPLISPDEGRYLEIAREMVVSGDFITPHLNAAIFLDKPILFYWFEAGVLKLLGFHEWSVRLVPAFFAWFGCLLTYWAGLKLYNRRTGLLAGLMQATMLMYFLLAHYCDMDLMVAVLLSAILWLFLLGLESHRREYFWLAYAFAGLAFLTKGLIAIIFPAMIVGAWIVVLSRWRFLKKIHLVSGLIIFLLVVSPWLILVQGQNPEFSYYFFIVQQFSRYLTHHFNSQQPFYFYFPVILVGIFPWSFFLFQSLIRALKKIKNEFSSSAKEIFLCLWVFLILIFFSIPHSKIMGYILPVFPAIAMLLACYLDVNGEFLPKTPSLKRVSFIFLLVASLLAVLVFWLVKNNAAVLASLFYFQAMALTVIFAAIFSIIVAYRAKHFSVYFITLLITALMVELISSASIKTSAFMKRNFYIKQLAVQLKPELQAGAKIVVFDNYYQDFPVYLQQGVYVAGGWDAPDALHRDDWSRELIEHAIFKTHARSPFLIHFYELRQMWVKPRQRVFVLASYGEEHALRSYVPKPIYVLQRKEGLTLLSNRP